jgi:nucleoside transporter
MSLSLRIRLSAMMFLEFFVWGAWLPVLAVYIMDTPEKGGLGMSADQKGMLYGLLAFASIFMPMIAGQLTDRLVPTQVFLALAHLVGGAGLLYAAGAQSYWPLFWGLLIWSVTYAPTLSLVNSLSFSHLRDAEREFGPIRVFGTIGWIAAGWVLWMWRTGREISGNDCLYLAGGAAMVMGLFCFFLPHTPPARSGVSPWAFLKALQLLKNPRIAVFLLISFVVGTELPFYFNLTGNFLEDIGTQKENTSRVMSIGQMAEILTMLALPFFLKKYGPRKTLFLGILAWPVRYLIFAIGQPYELVVASIALHGICFVFFFVVAFIYIDSVASADIKGSAQGLLTLVIYGFGMWLGSLFTGFVEKSFTSATGDVDWSKVFLVPTVLTTLCAIVLMATFPRGSMKDVAGAAPEPAV